VDSRTVIRAHTDATGPLAADTRRTDEHSFDFRSGEALMVCDAELRVLAWNEAAEQLTGIPADDAVGWYSWQVLGAEDETGAVACHAGCSRARLLRDGWPVGPRRLSIRAREGRKQVLLSTLALVAGGDVVYLHLLREAADEPERHACPEEEVGLRDGLTGRQLEILGLIADGLPAKVISVRLGLSETTIRNHIRGILVRLGCHSQLEAVATARRAGLL
jgi:DNA-binding CsgD family transcriptional regulator